MLSWWTFFLMYDSDWLALIDEVERNCWKCVILKWARILLKTVVRTSGFYRATQVLDEDFFTILIWESKMSSFHTNNRNVQLTISPSNIRLPENCEQSLPTRSQRNQQKKSSPTLSRATHWEKLLEKNLMLIRLFRHSLRLLDRTSLSCHQFRNNRGKSRRNFTFSFMALHAVPRSDSVIWTSLLYPFRVF
jgi:hypothetical protein